MPDDYLYNYTVYLIQGDGNEKRLAFYKSNSAPPSIGATLELNDFLENLNDGSEFKVVSVTIIPFRDVHDENPASHETHVDVRVKPS